MVNGPDILLIIVAILFPPAAVALMTGCSFDLILNVGLTLLGFIPGHIHAFYLIYKRVKAEETYGHGGYRYVGIATFEPIAVDQPVAHPPVNYGSTI